MAFSTSAPKQAVWWVAFIVGVLGLLGHFINAPVITPYQFWLVAIGFIILVLATVLRNM